MESSAMLAGVDHVNKDAADTQHRKEGGSRLNAELLPRSPGLLRTIK